MAVQTPGVAENLPDVSPRRRATCSNCGTALRRPETHQKRPPRTTISASRPFINLSHTTTPTQRRWLPSARPEKRKLTPTARKSNRTDWTASPHGKCVVLNVASYLMRTSAERSPTNLPSTGIMLISLLISSPLASQPTVIFFHTLKSTISSL